MAITLEACGGRYPSRRTFAAPRLDPRSVRAALEAVGDRVRLRLDDQAHPDFWIELKGDRAALLAELSGDGGGEEPPTDS